VRQTEEIVRRLLTSSTTPRREKPSVTRPEGAEEFESKLRSTLGTKVTLQRGRKGGRIVIEYYSDEEFSSIYEKIVGRTE
jgi:ParB family chromosome partitioning protein